MALNEALYIDRFLSLALRGHAPLVAAATAIVEQPFIDNGDNRVAYPYVVVQKLSDALVGAMSSKPAVQQHRVLVRAITNVPTYDTINDIANMIMLRLDEVAYSITDPSDDVTIIGTGHSELEQLYTSKDANDEMAWSELGAIFTVVINKA